jgi:hypothetical protein
MSAKESDSASRSMRMKQSAGRRRKSHSNKPRQRCWADTQPRQ